MTAKLFEAALGIHEPWYVASVDFEESAKTLTVVIDFKSGSRFEVSGHEGVHPVHDTVTKRVKELFGWRRFANRRELAGCLGLAPTPYASGDSQIEQGISKAGNRRARTLLVELAWSWLRLQPDSALSQWFYRRFAGGGKRMRRVGIVALARRLAIALWRYLEHGEIPAGATLKPATA